MPNNYPTGMRGFFLWLQKRNPVAYANAMPRIRTGNLSGLGWADPSAAQLPVAAQDTAPASSNITAMVKDIIGAASSAYLTSQQLAAQKKILDMQLQRAQAGLAPLDIDMSKYGATPQVGLDTGTKNVLIWIAAGIAGTFIVSRLIRR